MLYCTTGYLKGPKFIKEARAARGLVPLAVQEEAAPLIETSSNSGEHRVVFRENNALQGRTSVRYRQQRADWGSEREGCETRHESDSGREGEGFRRM